MSIGDVIARQHQLEREARSAAEAATSESERVEFLLVADQHANAAWALLNRSHSKIQKALMRDWK